MVPCALDICVATKVLDHSALADGLNLVSSQQLDKKIKALVLTPSTVWHDSVKRERGGGIEFIATFNMYIYTGKRITDNFAG